MFIYCFGNIIVVQIAIVLDLISFQIILVLWFSSIENISVLIHFSVNTNMYSRISIVISMVTYFWVSWIRQFHSQVCDIFQGFNCSK